MDASTDVGSSTDVGLITAIDCNNNTMMGFTTIVFVSVVDFTVFHNCWCQYCCGHLY